jgi:hypothetical protein
MDYENVIKIIKSNYPTENYTMLRKALDICLELLNEKIVNDTEEK